MRKIFYMPVCEADPVVDRMLRTNEDVDSAALGIILEIVGAGFGKRFDF